MFSLRTSSYLFYEVVDNETEHGHENTKDQDEEPVDDVRKNIGGDIVPHPCGSHAYHVTNL